MVTKKNSESCTDSIERTPYAKLAKHRSIYDFYHKVLRQLQKVLRCSDLQLRVLSRDPLFADRIVSRLYMWAQGLDLGWFEEHIPRSTGMQAIVAEELAGISRTLYVLAKITRNGGAATDSDDISEPDWESFLSIHRVNSSEDECDELESPGGHSENEGAIGEREAHFSTKKEALSSTRIWQLVQRVDKHITHLMDLLPTIKHFEGAEMLRQTKSKSERPQQSLSTLMEARPYVIQTMDKFPKIDNLLARRLGEANWSRFLRLRAMAMREPEVIQVSYNDGATFLPMTEFHDSGLGASLNSKTSYAESTVSHGSYLSTESAVARGALRVPSLPSEVQAGLPFNCSICGQTLKTIKNRKDWKMHVFVDIQPYICTFDDCKNGKFTFGTRKSWAEHEFGKHRCSSSFRCFECGLEFDRPSFSTHLTDIHDIAWNEEGLKVLFDSAQVSTLEPINKQSCPMCFKKDFVRRNDFVAHVCRHLEEISLVALRQVQPLEDGSTDDEAESDEEQLPKSKGIVMAAAQLPKTPFMQFQDHLRPQMEADNYPEDKIEARMELEWHKLSEENRALWEQRYQDQLMEHQHEMVAASGQPKGGRTDSEQQGKDMDPHTPSAGQPKTPYKQFQDHLRPQMVADNYPEDKIEARIDLEWRELSAATRVLWEERFQEQVIEYQQNEINARKGQRARGSSGDGAGEEVSQKILPVATDTPAESQLSKLDSIGLPMIEESRAYQDDDDPHKSPGGSANQRLRSSTNESS